MTNDKNGAAIKAGKQALPATAPPVGLLLYERPFEEHRRT
jgi:hypothetical protein